MQPVCKKVVVMTKFRKWLKIQIDVKTRGGGGGGGGFDVSLTLSVQWVGMDGFPKSHRVIVALDRQIGMEPLFIDWAKEEAKMAKIIRHIYVYC